MKKLKIWLFKRRLRRNYVEFHELRSDCSGGMEVFLHVSRRGSQLATRIDADLDRLTALGDSNVPQWRLN